MEALVDSHMAFLRGEPEGKELPKATFHALLKVVTPTLKKVEQTVIQQEPCDASLDID
jgi:hypothetical protein